MTISQMGSVLENIGVYSIHIALAAIYHPGNQIIWERHLDFARSWLKLDNLTCIITIIVS